MADEAFSFTFDPKDIVAGIQQINKALATVSESAQGMDGKMGGIGKGVAGMKGSIDALPLKFAVIGEVVKMAFGFIQQGVGKMIATIPEIGQTFSVVGEIFLKNFLWPVRQLLLPMLQRLLNWARDSRPDFVRVGVVFMNAFKVVLSAAQTLWTFLKSFVTGFTRSFGMTIGGTVNSIEQMINTFLVRLTLIGTAMQLILGPIFTKLGDAVAQILKAEWGSFFKGFSNAAPSIQEFIKVFTDLGEMIGRLNAKFGIFQRILGMLKIEMTIVGTAIGLMLRPIYDMLSAVVLAERLVNAKPGTRGKMMEDFAKEHAAGYSNAVKGAAGDIKAGAMQVVNPALNQPIKDGFISKNGRVTPISDQDNVLAFKGKMPGGGGQISVTIGGINLNVTEGSARAAGANFAGGMAAELDRTLRNMLMRQGELRGAF